MKKNIFYCLFLLHRQKYINDIWLIQSHLRQNPVLIIPKKYFKNSLVRIFLLTILTLVWCFLILAPLTAFAKDETFTCKPVIAGMPEKNGEFYVEEKYDESTPILDIIPDNQLLLRGEAKHVYFKNNSSRKFEVLVPYELIADIKEIKEIHEGLSGWDDIISLENFRTYYLRYFGDDGFESLKRISINEQNSKTAILTVPMADHPSYFTLFNCEPDYVTEPIRVEPSNDFNKKIS